MFNAAEALKDEPVEFWIGRCRSWFRSHCGVSERTLVLAKSRNAAEDFYRRAEIFVVRTMPDGFAITQLEAQAYRLPVIASKFCGKVVENGFDGIVSR